MQCVCCGYEPTPAEQAEQPYGCPKCEPESFIPPLSTQLKACAVKLGHALQRRFATPGSSRAK